MSLPLFMSLVSLCCLHLSNFDPLTQWIPLLTLLTKTFLNFTFFFSVTCPLPNSTCPYYAQLPVNKEKTICTNSTLSLSLYLSYLYNSRESHKHKVTESQSQKAKKKKKTPQAAQIQFTITNISSVHHSSVKTQTWNATSPQGRSTISMNLRFSNHKV